MLGINKMKPLNNKLFNLVFPGETLRRERYHASRLSSQSLG